jgi:hypothetical protein
MRTDRRQPGFVMAIVLGFLASSIACGLTINGAALPEIDAGRDATASLPDEGDADLPIDRGGTSNADAGDAADGPLPSVCVEAGAETCNGTDDDCDGIIDNPCPSGVEVGTFNGTVSFGGGGGTAFQDTCPAGEALIGLTVKINNWIRQIQGRCGKITVVENTSAIPYTYSIAVLASTTMPSHGSDTVTTEAITCPPNAVVVGASGREGIYVDAITLSCAPLSLSGSGSSFGLTIGAATPVGPVGGTNGGSVGLSSCAAGVVARLGGKAGSSVDSVAFSCGPLSIVRSQ